LNSVEKLAHRIVSHYGERVLDVNEAAEPFSAENAERIFLAAGASAEAAKYLAGCLSIGICAVMCELMPELKNAAV